MPITNFGGLLNFAETMEKMETRSIDYYTEGAVKINALPEASRALKLAGEKRTTHAKKLSGL